MFDYKLLEALERVGYLRSFEKAASELGITQSAISQRISTLEQRMGVLLVKRTKPIELTERGNELAQYTAKVKQLESEFSSSKLNLTPAHPLRIIVNADTVATWLFDSIAEFTIGEKNLIYEVIIKDQDEGLKSLSDGMAVGCLCSTNKEISGCRKYYLGTMQYRFYCSESFYDKHFINGVNSLSLFSSLAVSFGVDDRLHEIALERMGYKGSPKYHKCPSSEGLIRLVAAGLGYGLLPELQLKQLKNNSLIDMFPKEKSFSVPLYWYHWREGGGILKRLTSELIKNGGKILG